MPVSTKENTVYIEETDGVHDRFDVFDSIDRGRYKTGRAFVCIAVTVIVGEMEVCS